MTLEELTEKHAKMKKCKPASEDGCGNYKSLKEFGYRLRMRENGRVKTYNSWCKECQRLRDQARNKKHGFPKKIPVHHTGPTDTAGRIFFCRVAPTPLGIELRAERTESCAKSAQTR